MKAVIFDLGRVLIEYDQQMTMAALAHVSTSSAQQIRMIFGSIGTKLDIGEIGATALHQILIEQAGVTTDYAAFESAFCVSMIRNDFALNYVAQLRKRGIKIGIISNTNEAHTGYLRKILPELKEFEDVILSNEAGLRKPNPAIYQLSLQKLVVQPQDAVFVDDIAENVTGAEAVGIKGIVHQDWKETVRLLEQWIT